MNRLVVIRRAALLATLLVLPWLGAADALPTSGMSLPVVGKLIPRSAREIRASNWSVGAETLDRDYAVYANYARFVGPLGVKSLRVQTGWAKIERVRGVYDWGWLDAVVDDARTQGVQPWLELNYGNTLYPGGGDTGLGGGVPTSPEALAAWDRWARALVRRYKDRVFEWEIWNEPDINKAGTAGVPAYADLFVRTAAMVREEQPRARIFALGLAGSAAYAEDFLRTLNGRGRLDLVDAITVHGYPVNPDDTGTVDKVRAVVAKFSRPIEVRQGETGAPSKFQPSYALSKRPWTENSQAKWDLRRMLAHRAKDVPFNLFTMIDLHYQRNGAVDMNYKGLLASNADQTVAYAKPAYYAAQRVCAIFDDRVRRLADFPVASDVAAPRKLACTGYATTGNDLLVALWFSDAPVAEANEATPVTLTLSRAKFKRPLLVDLRTGLAYAIPAETWTQTARGAEFRVLPVYDSPLLIAEASAVRVAQVGP